MKLSVNRIKQQPQVLQEVAAKTGDPDPEETSQIAQNTTTNACAFFPGLHHPAISLGAHNTKCTLAQALAVRTWGVCEVKVDLWVGRGPPASFTLQA